MTLLEDTPKTLSDKTYKEEFEEMEKRFESAEKTRSAE